MPLLALTNLRKSYGTVEAVRGVSLTVEKGEVVAVIGPSGCGKSTLLRCINHLEKPSGGKVRLGGETIDYDDAGTVLKGRQLAQFRSHFGMVFQQFDLFQHMSVIENVMIGQVVVQKKPREVAHQTARDYLARVDLKGFDDRMPRELSGGQQQRVAMARALALSPAVLLLDEVTSALDPELVGEVLFVIQELAREGATMVLVTHEMAFARDVADKIVFMEAGRVEEEGPPTAIFGSPASNRLKSFLTRFHGAGADG